ncbi:MAG: type II toxin-antitoxin system RelE/ParE family toxin [Gallionella sp.]|nr:type II toxin-antitoxin system RelE/ParE family toxin [Gallionella sp.]
MPRIAFSDIANQDLARITEFMDGVAPLVTDTMLDALFSGIAKLETFPQLAKTSSEEKYQNLRELFVPFGAHGYAVLYEYRDTKDLVIIASIKHVREGGYRIT